MANAPYDTIHEFFLLLKRLELNKVDDVSRRSFNLFGRIERCVIRKPPDGSTVVELPTHMTYRPHRHPHVPMDVTSFVTSSEGLTLLLECESLTEVLERVISLEAITILHRQELVRRGELDHLLIIFSPNDVMTVPATIEGIQSLLDNVHPEAAKRFRKVAPYYIHNLAGPENFHKRLSLFTAAEWDELRRLKDCMWLPSGQHLQYTSCGCRHTSFDSFCQRFDELFVEPVLNSIDAIGVATVAEGKEKEQWDLSFGLNLEAVREARRMLYIMFSCNRLFGMDGFTYDADGKRVCEEFLALNQPLDSVSHRGDRVFGTLLLSEIDRFRLC